MTTLFQWTNALSQGDLPGVIFKLILKMISLAFPMIQHVNIYSSIPSMRGHHWFKSSLQWRHNERDGVSNDQPHDCLLNSLFRYKWKNHQSSASLAFVRGIHRWPVNSPHKRPVTRKTFPLNFDDVIMMAWCRPAGILLGRLCRNLSWYNINRLYRK